MATLVPTRQALIEERPVMIFDDLVNAAEIALLSETLKAGHFSKTEFARQETMQYRHWVCEIGTDQAENLSLYQASRSILYKFFEPGEYRCFRAYCNMASYGDMLMTHCDSKRDGPLVVTALWFVCGRWDQEWGGETLFFDDQGDAVFVASPRPGRVVVFDGSITHVGRAPNRICFEPRFTLALKFLKEG